MNHKSLIIGFGLALMLAGQALHGQQSEADRKYLAEIRAKAEKGEAQQQWLLGAAFHVGLYGVAKDEAEAVKWYRLAAEQGEATAQRSLGDCFEKGQGVPKDAVEAVRWYRLAAEQGNATAQWRLGNCFEKGQGVPKDAEEALRWIRKAAEQGEGAAQNNLALRYKEGKGVAKDAVEAVKWFRKAGDRERGDADAQFNLGICYANGEGVAKDPVEAVKWFRKVDLNDNPIGWFNAGRCIKGEKVIKDSEEAVRWIRKAAERGDAEAQSLLAFCFLGGHGVSENKEEGVRWGRMAADKGHAEAQSMLGLCYVRGDGVAKDAMEGVRWIRKAADQGYAKGQLILGVCYANGVGVAKDAMEAVRWIRQAADQGYAKGLLSLGHRYANGDGVAKDEEQAAQCYRMAAEKGESDAQFMLDFLLMPKAEDSIESLRKKAGLESQWTSYAQWLLGCRYYEGDRVEKNLVEAARWYRKAAERNYASAQSNLGAYYAKGEGVAKDYVEAYKWRLLAAAQGDEIAKKAVPALESEMTREQIAEGQKLARNFKPRNVPSAGSDSSGTAIAQSRPESSGTGFFITEDGYLITNEHVAGNGAQVRLVTAAGLLSAKVVKVDAANDLALLKTEGKFAALPVAMSRGVKLGSTVATVGFPNIGLQGFAPKLAKGEIASLTGSQDDTRYFQISVPVQPGNSGGALVDERGNVVGVVAAKLSAKAALIASGALPENVNYAVKSSLLLSFLESVPDVAAKLKEPETKERKFEDVVKSAEQAAVLVLVY